jgi:hypothetical protein
MVKITVDGSQPKENNPTLCILPEILRVFFILFAHGVPSHKSRARESPDELVSILLETVQKGR